MKLNKRIVLITGGSRDLGRNTALRLAENGADVIITFHHQKQAAGRYGGRKTLKNATSGLRWLSNPIPATQALLIIFPAMC